MCLVATKVDMFASSCNKLIEFTVLMVLTAPQAPNDLSTKLVASARRYLSAMME